MQNNTPQNIANSYGQMSSTIMIFRRFYPKYMYHMLQLELGCTSYNQNKNGADLFEFKWIWIKPKKRKRGGKAPGLVSGNLAQTGAGSGSAAHTGETRDWAKPTALPREEKHRTGALDSLTSRAHLAVREEIAKNKRGRGCGRGDRTPHPLVRRWPPPPLRYAESCDRTGDAR